MAKEKKDMTGELTTKRFTSDVVIYFLGEALLQLRGFIFLPIIAKTLGAVEYGIWTQITITLGLLTPVLMLRLETACVRYLGSEKNKDTISKKYFSMLFLIWLIVLLIVFLLFLFSRNVSFFLFGDATFILYSNLFAIMLLSIVTHKFVLNYYRTFNRIKTFTLIQLVQSFLQIGLMIFLMVYIGIGLTGAIYSFIIAESILSIFIIINIIKTVGFSFDFKIKQRIGPYLRFSIPLIPSGILNWMIIMSDRYIITHFLGIYEVGIYSASYSLGSLLMVLVTPISFTLLPTISKLWEQKKYEKTKKYINYSIKYFLILSIPAFFGILYLAPYILKSLATEEFITSRFLILFIVAGYIFFGLIQLSVYVSYLKEKTHIVPLALGIVTAFNVGFNFLYIPKYGIIGAAFTTFLSYALLSGIYLYMAKKWFPISFDIKSIVKSTISALIMFLFITRFVPKDMIEILVMVVVSSLIYFGCMILFKGIGYKEWNLIKGIIKKDR